MRAALILCIILTSCTQKSAEIMDSTGASEQSPAVQEQLVPGITHGNIALQQQTIDTFKVAFAMKGEEPDCLPSRTSVSDSWPLGQPVKSQYSNVFVRWSELWTFETCSKSVDVKVVYMLHTTSGLIDVEIQWVEDGEAVELS